MQCTLEEICAWFECSEDTIERAVKREKGKSFADYFKEKRVAGLVSLRRAQMRAAIKGNPTMLIWLGKQLLGQKEKHEVEHSGPSKGPITLKVIYEAPREHPKE